MSAPPNEEKINIIYKSKYNRKRKNQFVLLTIIDNEQQDTIEKWHHIALKSEETDHGYKKTTKCLSTLFRGITSNHNNDFYCLGCMHSYRTDSALKKHERLCGKHDYCDIIMTSEDKNILKYNPGEKSLKSTWIFYLDLECLLVKSQSSQNNPEKSYTERKAVPVPCGYSLDLVSSFDSEQDKHSYYRGTDCIEKLCKDLQDQATEIINFEEKEMIPLTDVKKWRYEMTKYCHICQKKFFYDQEDKSKYKLYHKVRDHCHYTGKFRDVAHSICNLRYKAQREISVVLHNGSTYDYHLLIKELAEKFKVNIDCLGQNTEKYIIFSVPLKKETKNNKLVTYKLKFIDSSRFMNLASLVDNFSKISKDCKKCIERNNIKSGCQCIKYEDVRLIYKCKKCDDISAEPISKLSKKFPSTYKFCKKGSLSSRVYG